MPPKPNRFGWLAPHLRTAACNAKVHDLLGDVPRLVIEPRIKGQKVGKTAGGLCLLWEYSRKVLRKDVPTLAQATGSCVANGTANALHYLMAMEIIRLRDPEQWKLIFWPYHYGLGRLESGISGKGDGSTGVGQAEAIRKYGCLPQDASSELPTPTGGDEALTYGRTVEYAWSDGRKIAEGWKQIGRKYPCRSVALVTSYEDVVAALVNGYPVTIASDVGFESRPQIDGGRLWIKRRGTWYHQMCVIGIDDSTSRPGGYIMNSWGADWPGERSPDDAPAGGFWADADALDKIVRQGDSFAYSQFDGFPEQRPDHYLI